MRRFLRAAALTLLVLGLVCFGVLLGLWFPTWLGLYRWWELTGYAVTADGLLIVVHQMVKLGISLCLLGVFFLAAALLLRRSA